MYCNFRRPSGPIYRNIWAVWAVQKAQGVITCMKTQWHMSFVQQHKKTRNTVGPCCFTQWLAWQVFTQLLPCAIYESHISSRTSLFNHSFNPLHALLFFPLLCWKSITSSLILPLFFTLSCLSLPESTLNLTHLHAHCHSPDHCLACSRNSFADKVVKNAEGLTSGMLGMWQLDSSNFPPASAARLFWTMNPNTVAHSWQRGAAYPSTVSLYGCWPKIL